MDSSGWTEFFFMGCAVLTPLLLAAIGPGVAVMAMLGLLVAGCACGIADPAAPHRNQRRRSR